MSIHFILNKFFFNIQKIIFHVNSKEREREREREKKYFSIQPIVDISQFRWYPKVWADIMNQFVAAATVPIDCTSKGKRVHVFYLPTLAITCRHVLRIIEYIYYQTLFHRTFSLVTQLHNLNIYIYTYDISSYLHSMLSFYN